MTASSPHGCSEITQLRSIRRRSVIRAGTLGLLGWQGLAGRPHIACAESATSAGFGRAKRCIFVFMWGGPSQLDTFDMKPDRPQEIRGEFQPISTSVPGLQICEHFERLAAVMQHVAVIRSLTHDDPAHLSSAHTLLTGHLPPVNKSDAEPPSDRDTPHVGSMLARLRPSANGLPPFVTMPWLAYHPAAPGGKAPGQNGGWLGRRYDPLLIEGDPSQADWEVPALALSEGLTSHRLDDRQRLLREIDRQQQRFEQSSVSASFADQQRQAFDLLASPQVRQAFDLQQEPDSVRDRYGRHIHGQCVLLARRLMEHGVPFTQVNWHNDNNPFWDTHGDNFNKLKNSLIPPADQALAALLSDLQERGLLKDTLVVWVGEFGRRPEITAGNAGREHHPSCYSGLLAGGGIRGGVAYGSSDRDARYPADLPTSPHDLAATVLHALGIQHDQSLIDRAGRPHYLYGGQPIVNLFG